MDHVDIVIMLAVFFLGEMPSLDLVLWMESLN